MFGSSENRSWFLAHNLEHESFKWYLGTKPSAVWVAAPATASHRFTSQSFLCRRIETSAAVHLYLIW
ncbi:hypothetical protein Nepgr_019830 [Nepenthes gracilis]|uniref:Uncharacterized protein n=1 Tax=Nepenthes gracilis TaxID=150966 RepID=A0AAD3SWI7_NEPGR|nr:hypothetical protein Nepgr_019830 [Nepenthes gracilis]